MYYIHLFTFNFKQWSNTEKYTYCLVTLGHSRKSIEYSLKNHYEHNFLHFVSSTLYAGLYAVIAKCVYWYRWPIRLWAFRSEIGFKRNRFKNVWQIEKKNPDNFFLEKNTTGKRRGTGQDRWSATRIVINCQRSLEGGVKCVYR